MPTTSLVADCTQCCALCCVAPAFSASDDFGYSKPAHVRCTHLADGSLCAIHAELAERGFRGCVVYECSGAGQKVTQMTFGGHSWEEMDDPAPMFEAFMVVRALHELLSLLNAARRLEVDRDLDSQLAAAFSEVEEMTFLDAASLCELDTASIKRGYGHLLRRVGAAFKR